MAITFNQIPPKKQGKLFYDVELGDILFHDNDPEEFVLYFGVCREGSNLILDLSENGVSNMIFVKEIADHDTSVDIYLHAFYELVEEVLPRLAQN